MSGGVQRTVFATPRAAEFLELRALQAQTGQPDTEFGNVVIKELMDNGLDGAESAGVAPVIEISARTDGEIVRITVADNGVGITADTVSKITDFDRLVSDKAKYRGPTRGAQGNAFKTLLGIPYALDVDAPVVIESGGVRHELAVRVDPGGAVTVDHRTAPCERTVGASVTVPLPADIDIDPWRWATGAALVNPHATITVTEHGYTGDDDEPVSYKPTDLGWSKWTPNQPASAHWYDNAAFAGLVYAHIRYARDGGPDKPLGEFVRQFDGLSSTTKAKAVRASVGGGGPGAVTHLSQLDGNDAAIERLHSAMRSYTRPMPARRLGPVGGAHIERVLDELYGVDRFWYKSATETVAGVGWIIEVAVADTDTDTEGGPWFAVNHSPSFGDPLGAANLTCAGRWGVWGSGTDPFLSVDENDYIAAVVHVICTSAQFIDKGKIRLVVPPAVADAAGKALALATKVLRAEAEQRRKDAAKAHRDAARAREAANKPPDESSVKAAVFAVLPAAKAAAGAVCAARTLYYKVRPLIQKYTSKELKYDYFSQTLLPEYERTEGPLPGLYYEARGHLVHPHDGKVIRLGTREVEAYTLPSWQFSKILVIEKTGLEAQLAPYQLPQRFDMAIIYSQGYAVTACRTLLAMCAGRDMQIFVLHDADINGYDIARTLREVTKRMPEHRIEVIDLGLTVPQAIAAGLERERFTRRKALPADLELDDDARVWFTGTPIRTADGKTHYDCTRCELNAFSADELNDFIEDGLARHGATEKLVPPDDVLDEQVTDQQDVKLRELVADEIRRMFDIPALIGDVLDNHPDLVDIDAARVRGDFEQDDTQSWRAVVRKFVDADIDAADLGDEIREALTSQLEQDDGGG